MHLENCWFVATDIFNAIFATGAAVTLIVTLFLDNTIPGTIKERGLHVWLQAAGSKDWWEVNALHDVRILIPTLEATQA